MPTASCSPSFAEAEALLRAAPPAMTAGGCAPTRPCHNSAMNELARVVTGSLRQHAAPSAVDAVSDGLRDGAAGEDHAARAAIRHGTGAAAVVGISAASAAAAGAGALTGYAGMAAAVSTLGLGGVTTTLASAAGITAASGASLAGAAATTALTAAVGGPVVAAGLVVGVVAATGYGLYRTAHWIGAKLAA